MMGTVEALTFLQDKDRVDAINKISRTDPSFDSLIAGVIDRRTAASKSSAEYLNKLTAAVEGEDKEAEYQKIFQAINNFHEYSTTIYQRMISEVCDLVGDIEEVVNAIPGAAARDEDTPATEKFFLPEAVSVLNTEPARTDNPTEGLANYIDQITDLREAHRDAAARTTDLHRGFIEVASQIEARVTTYRSTDSYADNTDRFEVEYETHTAYMNHVADLIAAIANAFPPHSVTGNPATRAKNLQQGKGTDWAVEFIDGVAEFALYFHEVAQAEADLLATQEVTGAGKCEQARDKTIGLLIKADEKFFPEHTKVVMPPGRERQFIDAYIQRAGEISSSSKAMASPDMNTRFTRHIDLLGDREEAASRALEGDMPLPAVKL